MRPINLLPPEVAEERSRRRRAWLLVLAGIGYVLVLVALVFYWDTRVAEKKQRVETQLQTNAGLEQEVASLGAAAALEADFLAKKALVEEALSDANGSPNDVDWGRFLNDLARLLPERVWVESFSGSLLEGQGGIVGQVTFGGVGFNYPDVSEWLRTLDSGVFAGVTGPWVSTASESSVGEEAVISFSSTAVLTDGAVSNRIEKLIPNPEGP